MKVVICLFMVVLGMIMNANAINELAQNGALAKVRIKVVDQDGLVVPEAKIWGCFTRSRRIDDNVLVDGMTDKYGMFTAEGRCNDFLRFDVLKDGYYRSNIKICFWDSKVKPIVADGKWQPYGAVKTVVLKKIKNPWAGVVVSENGHSRDIPIFGQWIGFDLEVWDWVPPYGEGKCSDVALRFKSDVREKRIDYTYIMDISFTNNPYAGAYIKKKDVTSRLQTDYEADTNGNYQTTFSFIAEGIPKQRAKATYLDQDAYLVFRTRTRVDDQGRLMGAHYGKIWGLWRSNPKEMLLSDGCFNPRENDPTIEGDQVLLYAIKNDARLLNDKKANNSR